MKRIVFTGVLCLFVVCSFAQKKNVNAAKNALKSTPPDCTEARNQIKSALTDPETANDAETWYTAGLIESKQFDNENAKEMTKQEYNESVMYSAFRNILPYFLKAAELDKVPDVKGKIKPRFTKDICAIVRANRPYYVNAGLYAYNQKDYKQAYEDFKLYGDIPAMDLFKGEKWNIAKNDTTEMQIRFNAGIMASIIPDPQAAITLFSEIKNNGYVENTAFKENELYQRLAEQYSQVKDTANYEAILKEGIDKFPEDDFFMQNMVNLSATSGNYDEAITDLNKLIARTPTNGQYYFILGQIYYYKNQQDEAIANLKKALELDPDNISFLTEIGREYYSFGIAQRKTADEISDTDAAKSKEAANQALDYFKQSMTFWEKIFQLDNKNADAISVLRAIYYRLGMNDEYDKMDALYNSSNKDQ